MKFLQKTRNILNRHPLIFAIFCFIMFNFIQVVVGLIIGICLVIFKLPPIFQINCLGFPLFPGVLQFIFPILTVTAFTSFTALLKYLKIFTNKNLLKTFILGSLYLIFPVAFSTQYIILCVINQKNLLILGVLKYFLRDFTTLLAAAFSEEVIFRGLILNCYITNFEKSKKYIWRAIILSSLFFGLVHIFNLLIHFQTITTNLEQCVSAMFFGILLSSIYLRGGSIFAITLLHTITNYCILIGNTLLVELNCPSNMPSDEAAFSILNRPSPASLLITATLTISISLFLLRKSKMEEIIAKLKVTHKTLN